MEERNREEGKRKRKREELGENQEEGGRCAEREGIREDNEETRSALTLESPVCLPSHSGNTALHVWTDNQSWLYTGSKALNSGPQTCLVRACILTELPLPP